MNDEILLNDHEVARILGVHEVTLRKWRMQGYGPPWVKVPKHPCRGHNIRYRLADVDAFMQAAEAVEK